MLPCVTLTRYYSELEAIKLEFEKLNLRDLEFTAHCEHCGWTSSVSGKGKCEEQKPFLKDFLHSHKGIYHSGCKFHKGKGKAPAFVPQSDVDGYMVNYRHQKKLGKSQSGLEES